MPRAGLTQEAVIARAAELHEELGSDKVTFALLAERLGVKTPSLYKHVDGVAALQRGISIRAKRELGALLSAAAVGKSREDAIMALSWAYRTWALAHPSQYATVVRAPLPGDTEDEATSGLILSVIYAVLAGYGLKADDAVDATRFFRSTLHGFVALETGNAFELPVDLEKSFARTVRSIVTALATWTDS
ncbi:MAG: WHG domain-containing protein [Chloroflexota bacterium]|nr:WHG domain-containing protein [Chloroflexota bacterium]